MKCLGCDRCEVRLGSWQSSDASLNTKCLGCDRCEVRLGSWQSSDASLRNESSFLALIACERVIPPTRQSQKELQLARLCNQQSTYLCFAEMTAHFANFQFTDFNQNAYQPIRDCVSWGQIRASVDFYWSSPLMKCHWISRGLLTKWICLRRSDSKNLENFLEFLEIMEIWW